MAKLGEAYIAVRADTSPFARDLDKLQPIADAVEDKIRKGAKEGSKGATEELDKAFTTWTGNIRGSNFEKLMAGEFRQVGRRTGKSFWGGLFDGFGDGRSFSLRFINQVERGLVGGFGSLGTVLDNGISSLPTQVKAAIVLGLAAATPFVIAELGSAISLAGAVGAVGVGAALASQFQEVQREATMLGKIARETFVAAAEPFVGPVLQSFLYIEEQIPNLGRKLRFVLEDASQFVEPLSRALVQAADNFLSELDAGFEGPGARELVNALADGLEYLGKVAGQSLGELLKAGEAGQVPLRDLIAQVGNLIIFFTRLIIVAEGFYNDARNFAQDAGAIFGVLFPPLLLAKAAFDDWDEAMGKAQETSISYGYTNVELANTIGYVVTKTDAETKALNDEKKAMDKIVNAIFGGIDAHIAFEQALDDLSDSLKENGNAFDFESQKGRNNLEAVGRALKYAQDQAKERAASHELTAQQAQRLYEQEVRDIYKVAEAQGLSRQRIIETYGAAINLLSLPVDTRSDVFSFLTRSANSAKAAIEAAYKAASRLGLVSRDRPFGGPGGFQEYAEGDIIREPTFGVVGEAGPEVILPMTKPARAAQLLQQSGLDKLLGFGSAMTVLAIFDGEPFQARIVKTVDAASSFTARQLSYGTRS